MLAVSTSAVAQPPAAVQRVTANSVAYVPATATAPAPLVVLLHGAGGDARSFLEQFKREADERGIILLSVQSAGRTWAQRKPSDREEDVRNIKEAIRALSASSPLDGNRTAVMGFSDGASYALSVGMAHPGLFRTIIAFSPGYAFAPASVRATQRIFIAHSRRDPVLPADNTRRMVKELESAGFSPEVHWFNGGHEIDRHLREAAFDFALAP
jgi:predicted esterase